MTNLRNSSYAIIPSYILDDDDIEEGAKNIYARISMYSEDGRCWASNQHFADKHKVSIRTIQNWLKQLVDKGYIEIEVEKGGFQTKRDIWITTDFKKYSTKRNTFHVDAKHISRPDEAHCTSYNVTSNSVQIKHQQHTRTREPADAVDDDDFSSFEKEKTMAATQPDIQEIQLTNDQAKACSDYTMEQIEEAKKITLEKCNQKANSSRVKFFFKVLSSLPATMKKPSSIINADFVKKELINWIIPQNLDIQTYTEYLEISTKGHPSGKTLAYSEKGFMSQLDNLLRKCNCQKKVKKE